MVSGTSDNDSIYNTGSNVTIDFGAGNDSLSSRGATLSINGGNDDDVIHLDPYFYGSIRDVTLTGGSGNDTFVVDLYYSNTISAVITDFTSNDVFVYDSDFDDNGTKKLSCTIENGNMIISNNRSSSD